MRWAMAPNATCESSKASTDRAGRAGRPGSSPERGRAPALLEPPDQTVALQAGQPVDPEDPVELIDLVLQADGEQAVGRLDLRRAVQVLIFDAHAGRAL